jgi:hypothetical protein
MAGTYLQVRINWWLDRCWVQQLYRWWFEFVSADITSWFFSAGSNNHLDPEIKHRYFASIATKYSLLIIMFTTCFGQRGPSSGEHYIRHYDTCRSLPVYIWKYTDRGEVSVFYFWHIATGCTHQLLNLDPVCAVIAMLRSHFFLKT